MIELHRLPDPSAESIRGYRHVACAVVGNTRWFGHNSRKTHTCSQRVARTGETFSALHAEQAAVLRVPQRIRHRIVLYVARVRSTGDFAMSRCCPMCERFLQDQGVAEVWYTDHDGEWRRL